MSILETLTEGIVQRDMQKEGQALLDKWSQTGLLEGLAGDRDRHNMARLLENQAKELLREASTMAASDVAGFSAVAFPIVRRVFAGLIANDLVSVQPMSLPSGLIFFLDFRFSPDAGGVANGMVSPRMGNTVDKSIYGTNQVGSQVTGGVNLVDASTKGGFSGPLRDGATGYAYASPSGSNSTKIIEGSTAKATVFLLNTSVAEDNAKSIKYDPDLLSITDGSSAVIVLDVNVAEFDSAEGDADFNNLSPFLLNITAAAAVDGLAAANPTQIRRLTDRMSAADSQTGAAAIRFVMEFAIIFQFNKINIGVQKARIV